MIGVTFGLIVIAVAAFVAGHEIGWLHHQSKARLRRIASSVFAPGDSDADPT